MVLPMRVARARHAWLKWHPVRWASLHTHRQYADAINALNGLQSNFAIVDELRKKGQFLNRYAIPEMLEWWTRAGYQQSDLDALNVVHVAGTKGKGSTATFIASILDQYRQDGRLNGTGLYTSPHLRHVRERIQINGDSIAEADFAKSFFELWDRFEATEPPRDATADVAAETAAKPRYFRYLTLMAFHTFLKRGVDSAVIECGIGGEFDSTNIVQSPSVAAITSIGLDHVDMLGRTVDAIAWHKGGIMKRGAAAFTSPQAPTALTVLRERAAEKGVDLQVVPDHPELAAGHVRLGLAGAFQTQNASLAIAAAAAHLRARGLAEINETATYLPPEFVRGLETAHLGGRCETRDEADITWHLDGAHTAESMQGAAQWFAECLSSSSEEGPPGKPSVLIFNQQTRDAPALLGQLHRTLLARRSRQRFTHVIFCSNRTFSHGGYSADLVSLNSDDAAVGKLQVQEGLAAAWRALEEEQASGGEARAEVAVLGSIEEAIELARQIAAAWTATAPSATQKCTALVTGSVHLVGGALEVLETQEEARST